MKKQKTKTVGTLRPLILSCGLMLAVPFHGVCAPPPPHTHIMGSVRPDRSVAAQRQDDVKGRVLDSSGNPMVGVTIVEKGTQNTAITDIDGNFTMKTTTTQPVLVVTYVGFETINVKVNNRAVVDITMKENDEMLGEVVVTGFGLAQKKESMTSAISTLGDKDISRSTASTVSGALVGKIAGINSRQTDGRPGASTSLQIRNMGTPLYVIDGVVKDEGQFNNLDQNDIEQISVLKDASASIYGVRAANGVVVVTTKRGGKSGKPVFSVNGYYGWQSLSRFAKPADADTYMKSLIQSQTVQGKAYTFDKEEYTKWQQHSDAAHTPFDWYDFIWKTAPQTYINMNVSGGSEKANYYFSVGHLDQNAIIRNYGGFQRTNVQLNLDAHITSKLKVGASVNGRIETRRNPGVPGGDDYWLPMFATYRNLPTKHPYANDNPLYPQITSSDPSTNFAILNYGTSGVLKDRWRVIQLNGNVEYEIIKGLKASWLGGYYLAYEQMNNHEYTWKLYSYDPVTDTYPVAHSMDNPYRERRTKHIEELTSQLRLNFDRRFGMHHVAAVLGMDASKRSQPEVYVHSMPVANAQELIYFQTMDQYDDYGDRTEARMGWLGRFNYDYADKYLAEFSIRRDGAWKWAPGHRWGWFPSGSLGWRVSEEDFWRESSVGKVVSNLKLRASYGVVGDDNVSGYNAFDYMSGYNYNQGGAVIDGEYVIGSQARNLPATTFSWIKAYLFDIGLDFGFLNNRLSGAIDYFQRRREGIPASRYDVLIPNETGFSLPQENLNSDLQRGIDGNISWQDSWQGLHYSIGFNFTYARRYDWEQYKPRFSNSLDQYRNSLNHRYSGIWWGYKSDGQFQSWEEIANWPIDNDGQGNKTLRPGDIKYKDLNGDHVINSYDERPIGYMGGNTPNFNYGFNVSLAWKGIDLAFDLTGASGLAFLPNYESKLPFHDGGNNPQEMLENTWHLADIWDANSQLIPGKYPMPLEGNSAHSNYWTSDFWLVNVKYLKLRNFELGYTFPKKWMSKAGVEKLRIYVAGQNLFTVSNKPGTDPEGTTDSGLQYPTTRIINVGFNLNF